MAFGDGADDAALDRAWSEFCDRLKGAGTQAFNNTVFNWSAGNWNSSGTTTISSGTTLNISSGADHDYAARAIVNNGIVNWTGGRLRSGSSCRTAWCWSMGAWRRTSARSWRW